MSEHDALVEKFKKMAAKEGLTLSDQEAAEYAAEWNAMQGGSAPAATRAAPPPAAKPPTKPTNAAQKGDAATPPRGGPKGTVTQKSPVVAREPEPVMVGPVAPPRLATATLTLPGDTGASSFMGNDEPSTSERAEWLAIARRNRPESTADFLPTRYPTTGGSVKGLAARTSRFDEIKAKVEDQRRVRDLLKDIEFPGNPDAMSDEELAAAIQHPAVRARMSETGTW